MRNYKTEFRAIKSDDGGVKLEGYSAIFDKPSENLGWGDWEVREYVAQGAFTNALKNSDCRAVFNHNPDLILGRETATPVQTLVLRQDNIGLHSTILMPGTQYANDLIISVERGDIREQSFCFVVARDRWEEDQENKISTRTILEIGELIDISPVTYPAYPDTSIAKRSFEEYRRAATGPDNTSATARRQKRFDLRNKEIQIKEYFK